MTETICSLEYWLSGLHRKLVGPCWMKILCFNFKMQGCLVFFPVCMYGFELIRTFFLVTFLLPGPGASHLWFEKSPQHRLPWHLCLPFFVPAVESRTIDFTSLGLSFPIYEGRISWLHRVTIRLQWECPSPILSLSKTTEALSACQWFITFYSWGCP